LTTLNSPLTKIILLDLTAGGSQGFCGRASAFEGPRGPGKFQNREMGASGRKRIVEIKFGAKESAIKPLPVFPKCIVAPRPADDLALDLVLSGKLRSDELGCAALIQSNADGGCRLRMCK